MSICPKKKYSESKRYYEKKKIIGETIHLIGNVSGRTRCNKIIAWNTAIGDEPNCKVCSLDLHRTDRPRRESNRPQGQGVM
jgi:hypothetical protein